MAFSLEGFDTNWTNLVFLQQFKSKAWILPVKTAGLGLVLNFEAQASGNLRDSGGQSTKNRPLKYRRVKDKDFFIQIDTFIISAEEPAYLRCFNPQYLDQ